MIIDITHCRFAPGYLPKATHGFFNPFFAGVNVAFRREALEAAGDYDPKCVTGEDVDMSIRVSRAGWELWFEPAAVVRHHDPRTFAGLLRQWYGYGLSTPYIYKKHVGRRRLQIYRAGDAADRTRPYRARCIADLPSPFYGLVFLSAYHLMHLALLALLIGALARSPVASMIAGVVALSAGLYYASIRFEWRHPLRSLGMLAMRYAADTAFVAGSLLGGIRERALFIQATRTR
jgi:cellulose synthase/poly-beta-1,6-N-acetylglucosamine synthase-like glycosyltransferase